MKESSKEAIRWWKQAQNDYEYARHGFEGGFYAQVCFQCHQICEKAIKAVHFGKLRKRIVLGHSLIKLAEPLRLDEAVVSDLSVLDQYYIPTRYPNGLPDGSPFEVYTRKQAEAALEISKSILDLTKESVPGL